MPPNRFESEVESFLEGSHGDRTHNKQRADHHTVTPLCGTLLKSSPSVTHPAVFSRKNSPSTPQNANFGSLFVRRANFFAHRTQPRANFETNDTSAATDAGQYETVGTNARPQTATIETAITSATADAGQRETAGATARPQTATIETSNTTATEKCTKNSFFSPAKAMSVSIGARPARAKAMAVSTPRTDERAKATGVSRERFPMPAGHCGAWPGFETTHRTIHQRPSPTGVKGAGGSGGHGRASRRGAERSEVA